MDFDVRVEGDILNSEEMLVAHRTFPLHPAPDLPELSMLST